MVVIKDRWAPRKSLYSGACDNVKKNYKLPLLLPDLVIFLELSSLI